MDSENPTTSRDAVQPISTSRPQVGIPEDQVGTKRGPNVGLWVQLRWVAFSSSVHSTVPLTCTGVDFRFRRS